MRKTLTLVILLFITCFGANANERDVAADHDIAVANIMKMRAWMQRNVDNTFLLFGDKINAPKACYEAAVSNYIYDLWREFAKADGCADDEALCNRDPKAMEDFSKQLKDSGRDINNPQDRKAAFHSQNIWYIAAKIFIRLRKLHYGLDPNDDANSFSSKRQSSADIEQRAQPITVQEKQLYIDQLNQYVSACKSLKPVAWTVPGNALSDDELSTVSVKVSAEALLISYMIAPQLTLDDRGYLGCIYAWNEAERSRNQCKDKSCADTVPVDDKATLKAKLDELKANGCDLTYALKMLPESAVAQPVKP